MKALWWLSEYPPDPGGIGTVAAEVGPQLSNLGVQLTFLVVDGPAEDSRDGAVHVVRRPIRSAFIEGSAASVTRWRPEVAELKEVIRPDVYHLHLCEPSPILHLLTESVAPAPMVLTLHNEMFRVLHESGPNSLLGRLVDRAAVITAVSPDAAEDFLQRRPEVADRLVVVPNGLVVGPYVGPPPVDHVVMAAGRLTPQKGFDRLIRALPALRATVPDVRVVVVGDGPERGPLRSLADSLDVLDLVEFVGHLPRPELREVMQSSRVVVMPSRYEGMPMVALEAGERGRPVVGTDVGGLREVVRSGTTGLLVSPSEVDDDPEVLAGAIARVLTQPGLAEEFGAGGRRLVEAFFTVDRAAETYRTIYQSVSRESRPPRVSVVIPAWNASKHLAAAVESALGQTFEDIEVLVVDDGSTDTTLDVARSFADARVVLLPQPHRGGGLSRNAGLALAGGEVVAHLDADDVWPADRLSLLLAALDSDSGLDAVFGAAIEFADSDAPPGLRVDTEPRAVRIPTTGVIRATAHRAVGPFAPVAFGDQMEWSMRALEAGLRYRVLDEVVLRRRVHAANNSHRYPFTQEKGRVALLKKVLDRRKA